MLSCAGSLLLHAAIAAFPRFVLRCARPSASTHHEFVSWRADDRAVTRSPKQTAIKTRWAHQPVRTVASKKEQKDGIHKSSLDAANYAYLSKTKNPIMLLWVSEDVLAPITCLCTCTWIWAPKKCSVEDEEELIESKLTVGGWVSAADEEATVRSCRS